MLPPFCGNVDGSAKIICQDMTESIRARAVSSYRGNRDGSTHSFCQDKNCIWTCWFGRGDDVSLVDRRILENRDK